VAKKMLTRVERESMAELGVGDLAKRREPTWTATVVSDRFDDLIPADDPDESEDAGEQLSDLLRRALDSGRLSDVDRDLLIDLAHAAQQVGAPLRRGRAGLTTPSVAQMVQDNHAMASRTIRRHAADALDVLGEVARQGGLAI